jgi:hypothetical protein
MVRTLKILTNADTNSIVRGQSPLRDVIERNGRTVVIKKNAMLDSLDAKERSHDNRTPNNGINFMNTKVNVSFHCYSMDILI